jgi:glycosyltransferase involved in cell wall biosynthesis
MKVAIVSGPRSRTPMGLELAEQRLLGALRASATNIQLELRVVGGRSAWGHARRVQGRWIPALPARPWAAAWRGADLVHLIGLDLPPPRDTPFVATVYDVSALHYDDEGALPPWMDEITRRAALLLTPSSFTATELHEHFGVARSRIHIFGAAPALDARGAEPLATSELRELHIERPVALRYGGYTTRKNLGLLLEAWATVSTGTLVLVGPSQPSRAALLARAPTLNRVVVLDYVPAALLARLLQTAAVVVSPSLYEGFGLPPLEAMAAGVPVIAVATAFAREVCGDAAVFVANDPAALAAALTRVMTSNAFSEPLRAAGRARAASFSWQSAAAAVLQAYHEAGRI